jgi:hypothetical protein
MYSARTGGSVVTNPLISNSQGEIEAWFDTPQTVDLLVTDRADAAYYPSLPSTLLNWADFTETAEVIEDPSNAVWFNVKSYGATGDGVTDDTTAIQAAITAAGAGNLGGTVFFPRGTFLVTGLTFPPRVNFRGVGAGTSSGQGSTIKLANGSNQHVFRSSQAGTHHWTEFRDLLIDGNGINQTAASDGIYFERTGEGTRISHADIRGCYRHGVHVELGCVPLFFYDVHVIGNGKGGAGSGIKIRRAAGNSVNAITIFGVSGDDNQTALVELEGINGGPVTIIGLKAESTTAGLQQNSVLIVNGDDGKFFISGAQMSAGAGGNAVIRAQGSSTTAQIVWFGVTANATDIPYILDNNATGVQIATNSTGTSNVYGFSTQPLFMDGLKTSSYIQGDEIADPAAPAANKGRLYFRDNGAGKTQLVALFPTGAVQVIATEP